MNRSGRRKVTVVGAGFVGSTAAQRIIEKGLADVVMVDIAEGIPQGKALDMMESGPVEGFDMAIVGTNGYEATAGSDVVVVTAGLPRKPGMSRDDLLKTNAGIVKGVCEQVAKYSPDAIMIIVSNPLDAMCHVALTASGFPAHRVIGMAGVLDGARMRHFIADAAKVSVKNVQAFVLGGHGDTMVPLMRYATISGIPVDRFLDKATIDAIATRTRNGGIEIVNYLKTGSAYYAPSSSAVEMVDAILNDRKELLPCAVYLNGQYGAKDLFLGVLAKLGKDGVEQVIELELLPEEQANLDKSIAAVKELVTLL
ncbi:MAG: malate dehydrogenase [Holophagaceae bacterium]|nr:malate dehydrogenase [Holophagaceae bacterium]